MIFSISAPVYAAQDNSVEDMTVTEMEFDKEYTGELNEGHLEDTYKIVLTDSGKLHIQGETEISENAMATMLTISMVDLARGVRFECGNDLNGDIYLKAGVYDLIVSCSITGNGTCNYKFTGSFQKVDETFKEEQGGVKNGSFEDAYRISLNAEYTAMIADGNMGFQYYVFVVPTDETIQIKSKTDKGINYDIFDENQVWVTNYMTDRTDEPPEEEIVNEVKLSAGKYYLRISLGEGPYSATGVYQFQIVSDIPEVPADMTGVSFGGRAGDALRVNWEKNETADGYMLEMFRDGNWQKVVRIEGNDTQTYRVERLNPSTTYSFRIRAFKKYEETVLYSTYSYITGTTNPATVSGLKIGGRAGDALRLNWEKNPIADGYIIQQYKDGKWVRIARIGSNNTTTYRVEKLDLSTTYKFRIQAFEFSGKFMGTNVAYGDFSYVNGKTNPGTVAEVRIGGRANDALRINWNKDSKVSGYIIQQYKDGKWVRIARIANNDTTTYRVSGLNAGTTYKFRVQAFELQENAALYGSYGYVSGTTYK